ncbi:MAG: type IX secretion system outer membrane channel protein PorV [Bacteroidetes bacterium]|nr:type IX secretion system outer membrane channel protein PorV [Bacteroidota bacterium]
MKRQNLEKIVLALVIGILSIVKAYSQISASNLNGGQNTITTAVPFLLISPDARGAGLGDAGGAMPNDVNAMHWNIAKLPFNEKKGAVGLSYTPWLRNLVPDISLSYLSFYSKYGDRGAFAGSLRYFSLGQINFTDNYGNPLGNYNPNELAVDLGYASKLSENFSIGIAFRYIYSNLAAAFNQSQNAINAGTSFSGDIGAYYKNKFKYEGKKFDYGIGLSISNIGSKLTYTSAQYENYIPINLRLSTYTNLEIDKYNSIAFLLDFNKLLVPTPPQYFKKANSIYDSLDINKKPVIKSGQDPNVPVVQGMFQSFYDAPGGVSEELDEINISAGLEYWYEKQFALRGGYFHEPQSKGNRQYATVGVGLRYNVFGLDVAYLWPFAQRHPLENTLRFTLLFDFEAFASQKDQDKKEKKNNENDDSPKE